LVFLVAPAVGRIGIGYAAADLAQPRLVADDGAFLAIALPRRAALDELVHQDGLIVDRGDDNLANLPHALGFLGAQKRPRRTGALVAKHLLHGVPAGAEQTKAADVEDVRPLEKIVAANVGIAAGDGVLQLRERDAVPLHAVGIGTDLVAL